MLDNFFSKIKESLLNVVVCRVAWVDSTTKKTKKYPTLSFWYPKVGKRKVEERVGWKTISYNCWG
jgi:hypothetical protein